MPKIYLCNEYEVAIQDSADRMVYVKKLVLTRKNNFLLSQMGLVEIKTIGGEP